MVVIVRPDGRQAAEPCECQTQKKATQRLRAACIPKRYEQCYFENFYFERTDDSLTEAWKIAHTFADRYPSAEGEPGLLFTGSVGLGKTHLAVSILRVLVMEKSARCLFCDYRELLKQIQHSYNQQSATTELGVLAPIFEAEVLVLDELGAQKPTDWVWDTVALILNTRYNDKRTTIITTNYPNLPPGGREETLGDRIGERMRSRLFEMCVEVPMRGADYRQSDKKRARLGTAFN